MIEVAEARPYPAEPDPAGFVLALVIVAVFVALGRWVAR